MGDEPYRTLAGRMDSPNRQLPIEHLVDTRLCVSAHTTAQCHQFLRQLDHEQVKNAVFDRALCFPFAQWTQNIRASYAKQVQVANRVVISFENITQHAGTFYSKWKNHLDFGDQDLRTIETLVKCHLAPSMDNIGVYASFSDYTVTKINGLAALLKIGQILVEIPIITSARGRSLFTYDPLSRSGKYSRVTWILSCPSYRRRRLLTLAKVANILSTTMNDAGRRQVLDPGMEAGFKDLAKRSDEVGLFPGLLKALLPGAEVRPYNIPLGEHSNNNNNMNKRASDGQPASVAKRTKVAQPMTYCGYLEQGLTPVSSQASSEQPRGVTEGWPTESREPQNPFSRPASAGPISPLFSKRAHSTPTSLIQVTNQDSEEEQSQGSIQDEGEGFQGIAREATEHQPQPQPQPQDGYRAIGNEQAQHDQAAAGIEASIGSEGQHPIPIVEGQGTQQPDQRAMEQATENGEGEEDLQHLEPSPYDDMLLRIENEMFQDHINKAPDSQLAAAPAAARLVENTCSRILQNISRVAAACKASARHDLFLRSLNDTVFALLWVFESCALNVGGTPFTAEVSRMLVRNTLVGALWGTILLADRAYWIDLVSLPALLCRSRRVHYKPVRLLTCAFFL